MTSVLADVCPNPPSFDVGGAACPAERQDQSCVCSETLTWDPVVGAEWYRVQRCEVATSVCQWVGSTRWKNRKAFTDPSGIYHPAYRPTHWTFAWDVPFPVVGELYEYAVKACRWTGGSPSILCSEGLSNRVRYRAAPYMCIADGHEVPCRLLDSGDPLDLDGDGLKDLADLDDDNDTVPDVTDLCSRAPNPGQRDGDGDLRDDVCDNCPLAANVSQADSDGDGKGDVCDDCPLRANAGQEDVDLDGVGNVCDNCPSVTNPGQEDGDGDHIGDVCDDCPEAHDPGQTDRDRDLHGDACDVCPDFFDPSQANGDFDGFGDACDNCPEDVNSDQADLDLDGVGDRCDGCPALADPSQTDRDSDGIGDRCDAADGLIYLDFLGKNTLGWQPEPGRSHWNIYRGRLSTLRAGGPYTQAPGSNPLAARWCRRQTTRLDDLTVTAAGEVAFYLVTGILAGVEDGLGEDGAGNERPNDNPCP